MGGSYPYPVPGLGQHQSAPGRMYMAPAQQQYDLIGQLSNLNLGQGRPNTQRVDNKERKKQMNQLPSLYVSNLPKENFLNLDFQKFFVSKGYKIFNAKIVLDTRTNKSRGYGYLQFVDPAEADRCLREMNNQSL